MQGDGRVDSRLFYSVATRRTWRKPGSFSLGVSSSLLEEIMSTMVTVAALKDEMSGAGSRR